MIDYPPDVKYGSSSRGFTCARKAFMCGRGVPVFSPSPTATRISTGIIHAFKDAVADMQEARLPADWARRHRTSRPAGNRAGRISRIDVGPVTEAQREIFYSVQMGDEANCAYNEASVVHFEGKLDMAVLERSFLLPARAPSRAAQHLQRGRRTSTFQPGAGETVDPGRRPFRTFQRGARVALRGTAARRNRYGLQPLRRTIAAPETGSLRPGPAPH